MEELRKKEIILPTGLPLLLGRPVAMDGRIALEDVLGKFEFGMLLVVGTKVLWDLDVLGLSHVLQVGHPEVLRGLLLGMRPVRRASLYTPEGGAKEPMTRLLASRRNGFE